MVDDEELVLEFVELLASMHAEQLIELATIRDIPQLADQLLDLVRRDPELDLGEWLLEQDEITELYLDSDELASRIAPIVRRIREGDPAPQWNDALAAVIADAPDDLAARQVFADWLQQAGDPRGELAAIQLALARNPSDELRRRETSFLRRYRTYLYGPLGELGDGRVHFRSGFVDELSLDSTWLAGMLAHPSLRFLRSLTLTNITDASIVATPLPVTVTELRLYADSAPELRLDSAMHPKLQHLGVAHFETTVVDLAVAMSVRALELTYTKVAVSGTTWARAFPALESLVLGVAELDDPRALCVAPPPSLRSLKLFGEPIVRWLAVLLDSPLLAQLRVLDLRSVRSAEAAPLLLAHAAQLRHLEQLDVRGTNFGAELAGLGAFVTIDPPVAATDDTDREAYDDEDEDEDDDDFSDESWDPPGFDPDTVPEDEAEETDEAEAEVTGVDSDAPIEERFEEPE